MVDVDPTSGLSLPSYASHGVNVAFMFNNLSVPVAIHAMDCLTIHFFLSLFLFLYCLHWRLPIILPTAPELELADWGKFVVAIIS